MIGSQVGRGSYAVPHKDVGKEMESASCEHERRERDDGAERKIGGSKERKGRERDTWREMR
eukprot:453409-Hanusia_phi.AAC.2